MAIFKKSIIIILCMILAFSPLLYCGDFSYAASNSETWETITDTKYLVAAVKAYFQKKGFLEKITGNFTGSNTIDANIIWKYQIISNACNALGTTVQDLQQSIQYTVDENGVVKFLYSTSALALLNNLYAQVLDDYGLNPDQSVMDQLAYSGELFTDYDGKKCCVWYLSGNGENLTERDFKNYVTYKGTKYRYNGEEVKHLYDTDVRSIPFHLTSTVTRQVSITLSLPYYYVGTSSLYKIYSPTEDFNGEFAIFKFSNGNYNFGIVTHGTVSGFTGTRYSMIRLGQSFIPNDINNMNVNINNNNNNYNPSGPLVLTPNDSADDYIPDNNPDEPTVIPYTPPAPPTDPYVPTDTGGNIDPQDGDINWHMPDINVDWDLGDFSDIFPFSIPYDIIELFDIVDSEPITPAIYQEVDFGAFNYTIDFDLSYFDEFMEYVRSMELFLYTLTLFIATRGIFKIY